MVISGTMVKRMVVSGVMVRIMMMMMTMMMMTMMMMTSGIVSDVLDRSRTSSKTANTQKKQSAYKVLKQRKQNDFFRTEILVLSAGQCIQLQMESHGDLGDGSVEKRRLYTHSKNREKVVCAHTALKQPRQNEFFKEQRCWIFVLADALSEGRWLYTLVMALLRSADSSLGLCSTALL